MLFYAIFRKPLFVRYTATRIKNWNLQYLFSTNISNLSYKYLLIVDFEATCDTVRMPCREIIEFPCLKINLSNLSEEGRFHQYVKPVHCPTLSSFCIQFTGIIQELVDNSMTFKEVLTKFENWREQEGLTSENSLYVTSGDWDFGHMIPSQLSLDGLDLPSHMIEWADIKKVFGCHKIFYNSFSDIMKYYGLQFKGRAHSGIDDCLNILQVVKKMNQDGIKFEPTSRLVNSKVEVLTVHNSIDISNTSVVINPKYCSPKRKKKF